MPCVHLGSSCSTCHALPARLPSDGRLYLFMPSDLTWIKLRKALEPITELESPLERCLGLHLQAENVLALVGAIEASLSELELTHARGLLKGLDEPPSLVDVSAVSPLRELLARFKSGWLTELLEAERLTSHFQPIVSAKRPEQVFAYEALLRGLSETGQIVPPDRLFGSARDAGLLPQLDLAARRTAMREAARFERVERVFININPAAIYDPRHCLSATLDLVGSLSHDRIVIEIVESDRVEHSGHLHALVDAFRDQGFGIALDDFGSGYSSLNLLHELRPDFLKLDRKLVQAVHQDRYKALIVEHLLELTRRLGIRTIAEGIEEAAEWRWVQAHGADFVQGYLFGRPASPPPVPAQLPVGP
ncbi:MAG TPA: EAL domain-containing protein [Stenomitos sp.]